MKIQCLAVDDEPYALEQIVAYIRETPFLELKGKCKNSFEVLEFLETASVDLIFLDINMPEMSGMELIKSLSPVIPVVFTTAYSQHAVESYKVDALDYLLKPITYEDFLRAAQKAQKVIEQKQQNQTGDRISEYVFVHSKGRIVRIAFKDIDFIESSSEYVKFVLGNKSQVITLSRLKNLESVLPKKQFMRVHRSFIVNLERITTIERNRIVFQGNIYVPVSEHYKTEFRNFINSTFL